MQGINSRWSKQCLRAGPGSWRGIGEWGQLKWEFLRQVPVAAFGTDEPRQDLSLHPQPALEMFLQHWNKAGCGVWLVQCWVTIRGILRSALGLRQQEEKSPLPGKCLPSASFCSFSPLLKRGENRFYFSVRWNYCLAILNACKYIFLWFIKGVSSDLLKRECFEKNSDANIDTGIVFMGEIPANVQFSSAFVNVELRNNICIVFHVLQKVSCFCAGVIYWAENLPLYCS